jgi:hypothetical protein
VTFVKPKRGIDARLMRKNVFTKMHTMDIHEPRSRNIAVWLGKVTCSQIWFQRFGRRIKKSLKTSVTGQSRRFTQKVKPKKNKEMTSQEDASKVLSHPMFGAIISMVHNKPLMSCDSNEYHPEYSAILQHFTHLRPEMR